MEHKVAVGPLADFDTLLDQIGGLGHYVKPGARVFLKPNLCAPTQPGRGIITNPAVVEQLLLRLRQITPHIVLGDGPILAFGRLTRRKYPDYFALGKKYGVELVDLNYADKGTKDGLIFPRALLESDIIINLPVMKTHGRTGISVCLKNFVGIVPLRLKHEMHKNGLDEKIVEVAKALTPQLNIVDATVAQEGDGPTNGSPVAMNLLVMGSNWVAVDATCCRLMTIPPESVLHLKLAEKAGLGSTRHIEVLGMKEEYKRPFHLPFLYRTPFSRFLMQISEGPIRRFFERNNKIVVEYPQCAKCGLCVKGCPTAALTMGEQGPVVSHEACILCLCCQEACLHQAIHIKKKGIGITGRINVIHAVEE